MTHETGSKPADEGAPALGRAMGKGLGWSLLNNVIGRLGNFLSGIVIVRILSTSQYGVYAVGLVVLTVLLSMNELGVSVAIVQRRGQVRDIAPTVMTLSLISSTVLALLAFFAAPSVARGLGTPEATWLIRLLLVGVLIDGAAAVPNALITRSFAQRVRLRIDLIAFLVGTPITIGLAIAGFGAWSLGWGAVVANLVTGALAFVWAPERYRPGLRRESVGELLHFGLPLAGASLLLFMMLNVDYVVVGHRLGPEQLGLYLLAFNLCSWPISVISTAIRRVTLASFARMSEQHDDGGREGFAQTVGLVMALTLPVCVVLGAYAGPVIEVLYGSRWLPAAQALRLLAVLGATRVAVELTYDFLAATGRTRSNLWLHGTWLVVLIPTLIIGANIHGIEGVAGGHAIVSVALVLPLLTILLSRAGMSLRLLAKNLARPAVGTVLVLLVAYPVDRLVSGPLLRLLIGCLVSGVVYLVAVYPMRRVAEAMWNMPSGTKQDPVVPDSIAADELVAESIVADSVRQFE
jgi:O-antigen/teichoic acid export membrane protein